MNSQRFLDVIRQVLTKKMQLAPRYSNPQKVFVFVISPEFPFIIKGFKVHWYKQLWFNQIFNKDNSNK